MKQASLMFTLFMLKSRDLPEVHVKLNALNAVVNTAATNWDTQLNARGAAGEVAHRRERERREGAVHRAGVTKEMELRGVDSRAEAHLLLTTLQAALNGGLGRGYALGHVGIRGSASDRHSQSDQHALRAGYGPVSGGFRRQRYRFLFLPVRRSRRGSGRRRICCRPGGGSTRAER